MQLQRDQLIGGDVSSLQFETSPLELALEDRFRNKSVNIMSPRRGRPGRDRLLAHLYPPTHLRLPQASTRYICGPTCRLWSLLLSQVLY